MWRMNCNKWSKLRYIVLFLLVSLTACGSESNHDANSKSESQIIKKIESFYQQWRKTTYRYGGNSLKGIDCSGLTKTFYQQNMGKTIPRQTSDQLKAGETVSQLVAGDLVFFKSGRGRTGLHVGIYYKNGLFLHASTNKGVQYSNMNDYYWRKHYLKAKRLVN